MPEEQKEKKKKKDKWRKPRRPIEQHQTDNICIMRVLGEGKEKGIKSLFEKIIARHFPNLRKEMGIEIQEA